MDNAFSNSFKQFKRRGREAKTKAQIALWMLTKFAMIFFILALAFVLTSYSGKEKASLCQGVAQATANGMRSAIVNVMSSPVEDERKVIPLESKLSVGKEDFEAYEINVTDHDYGGGKKALIIEVLPTTAKNCFGGANVPYESIWNIRFGAGGTRDERGEPRLRLLPSARTGKTLYLVLIKCGTKAWPPAKYLFMEACPNPNPNTCMNFSSVEQCCGWDWGGGSQPNCPENPLLVS